MSWNKAPKWVRPVAFVAFVVGTIGLRVTTDIDVPELAANVLIGWTLVSGLIGTIIGKNGGK